MIRRKAVSMASLLTLAVAMLFTSCGGKEEVVMESTYDGPTVVDTYHNAEPETLDCQQLWGNPEMILVNMFMEGLVRQGKVEGEYIPGVAKSWNYDEAANTWAFELRDDAIWSNGEKVTADDFFFGWRYALDDQTVYSFLISDFVKGAGDYAAYTKKSFLTEVLGSEPDDDRVGAMTSEELKEFKAKKDELWKSVGAKVDGNTLTISMSAPCPFFPGLAAFPVFFPVNEAFFNEHTAAGDYTLEISGLLANGPFKFTDWVHKDYIKVEKNPDYWNKDAINIDVLNLKIITDIETRTNMLKTGLLDGSAIQAKDVPDFQDVATLEQYNLSSMVSMPDYTVFYTEFNHTSNPIMKNANIRKAMAYAMDREEFVKKINIGDTAAYSMVPDFFPGLKKSFREENGMKLFEDNNLDQAGEFLAKGLEELGLDTLPELDMLTGESDIAKKINEKFQADWARVGITVNLVPVPWGEKLKRLKDGDFALSSSGWGPDYPDPMTFLDLFETTNGSNNGRYSHPEYDRFINEAKAETNAEKRMELMYAAEKHLMDNMVILPQYFRTSNRVRKTYLTGVVNRGIGNSSDYYWADVDMEAKLASQK
jgi:oligopeptide transport system substrate-binding protein